MLADWRYARLTLAVLTKLASRTLHKLIEYKIYMDTFTQWATKNEKSNLHHTV